MVGFTTAVNSIFVFIIIAAYVFGGHEITAAFGLNLLFYIIITPILTTTLMKLAYAGEAQMQVVDGLKRMGDVMNRQSLKETTNGQIPKRQFRISSGCNICIRRGKEKCSRSYFH